MTTLKLPHAIPTVENIKDLESQRIITAIRSDVEVAYGVTGSQLDRFMQVKEMIELGILAVDDKNRLYFTPGGLTQTTVATSSTDSTIAQEGWLTGKLDLTGAAAGSSISLPFTLPPFARINKTFYEVLTGFTAGSGAPTVGISVQYDGVPSFTDLVTASILGTGWTAGVHDGIQDYAAVNISDITDNNYYAPQADIAGTGDISAGVFRIFVHYFVIT